MTPANFVKALQLNAFRLKEKLACVLMNASSLTLEHSGSTLTHTVLQDGKLEHALRQYKPSWFYVTPFVGSILSVFQ